ncbi:MAG: hypothetical protein ABUS56_03850 [Acidobacteriota bacterium]
MRYRYVVVPHPHIVIDEIVAPDVYTAMRFPDEYLEPDANWGLTSTDARYADVLADPNWRALHDTLRGERFVSRVLRTFAPDMKRAACLVDPDRARLTGFVESRADKARKALVGPGDPNDVFTRLDFQSKRAGHYREFVHLDWPRRVVGGILFFSDADEEGLVGGELALYRDRGFRNDRWCHAPERVAAFPARHNTGVIFLNSNAGFHGPCAMTALRGRRRWLYYTISSRSDVWPCARGDADDSRPPHALDRG